MAQSIGIDVGKKELVACLRSPQGTLAITAPFPNSSIGLDRFIVHLQEKGISVSDPILLESTGAYHWQAARTLTDAGYLVKVINPLHTKQMTRFSVRKRKTDRVDSTHLAFLAAQNYGYRFVETAEMAKKKALVRHYFKVRKAATAFVLHERYLKEYRGVRGFTVSATLRRLCDRIKVAVIHDWESGNDMRYLDSIPGITPFLGAVILAELTPLDRFTRLEQIVAFAGLDPAVKQTGGRAGLHGKITKRGSSTLREALYLAAFGAFCRPPFATLYQRYKDRGLHHNTILCILSRKILRTSVALLTKRQVFDPARFS